MKSTRNLHEPSRRNLLKGAGLAGAGTLLGGAVSAQEQSTEPPSPIFAFLQPREAAFIRSATARLIPGDEASPGAEQADVTNFIDKALAGGWGAGERSYLSGPWLQGASQFGYQLRFTPAELYRTALRAIDRDLSAAGTPFETMSAEDQDAYLSQLENGVDLDGVPSNIFFDMLLENTIEGYLSDPKYGGNRNMVGWKAIGFPGAFASWYDLADKHGIDLSERQRNPVSIADAVPHNHTDPEEKKGAKP